MRRPLSCLLAAAALCGTALAEERLAVFEFLARKSTYCIAGAPAVITLQQEMSTRAVLLEYDFDAAMTAGRYQCYRAANPTAAYLPLVMVGSGYRTETGPVDYLPAYRSMIEQELARPPEAAVTAYWRRRDSTLRVYVGAENRGAVTLTPEGGAALWVIVWENGRIRLTDTMVRAVVKQPLVAALAPGAAVAFTVDTPVLTGVDWGQLAALAMVERRTAGGGRFDMLQAAVASPAAVSVLPAEVRLSTAAPAATVALSGPAPLTWTAHPDAPWIAVEPAAGTLPATVTVQAVAGLAPPGTATGTVRFAAAGDGLEVEAVLGVTCEGRHGTIRRRLQRAAGCGLAPVP